MSNGNQTMDAAEDGCGTETADWVERVSNASNDFETVGAEVAADLGL